MVFVRGQLKVRVKISVKVFSGSLMFSPAVCLQLRIKGGQNSGNTFFNFFGFCSLPSLQVGSSRNGSSSSISSQLCGCRPKVKHFDCFIREQHNEEVPSFCFLTSCIGRAICLYRLSQYRPLCLHDSHPLQARQRDYLNDTQVSLNEAIWTALPIHYCQRHDQLTAIYSANPSILTCLALLTPFPLALLSSSSSILSVSAFSNTSSYRLNVFFRAPSYLRHSSARRGRELSCVAKARYNKTGAQPASHTEIQASSLLHQRCISV